MPKRVAFICEGSPSINKTRDANDLQHLSKNCKKVSSYLEEYGNWEIVPIALKNPSDIKEKLEPIDDNIDIEILFYYTGHGVDEGNKFFIVGSEDKKINFEETILCKKFTNASVTIILDACHSGIVNIHEPTYEVLASTYTAEAYEFKDENEPQLSYFTHYFCLFLESIVYTKDKDIFLKDFMEFSKDKKYKYLQHPTHIRALQNEFTKINTLVYPKYEEELIAKLTDEISNQISKNDFIKLTYEYIVSNPLITEIININSDYKDIIEYLININNQKNNKVPLFCILKRLKQEGIILTAIEFVKKKYDFTTITCKSINQNFEKLIVYLKDLDKNKYSILLWGQSEKYEIPDRSFSRAGDEIEKTDLFRYLEETVFSNADFVACDSIEFILPYNLLIDDIKSYDKAEDYINDYDISYKMFDRVENNIVKRENIRWKKNWKLYEEYQSQDIKDVSTKFGKDDLVSIINKDMREKYSCLILTTELNSKIYNAVYRQGISIILYPLQKYKPYRTRFSRLKLFKKKKTYEEVISGIQLKELRTKVPTYIRDNYFNKKTQSQSHIALIWDNPNTTPKSLQERNEL